MFSSPDQGYPPLLLVVGKLSALDGSLDEADFHEEVVHAPKQ